MSAVVSDKGVVGLWFIGQQYFERGLEQEPQNLTHPYHLDIIQCLNSYFLKEKFDISQIPFDIKGTTFQKEVWSHLKQLEFGESLTYGELAKYLDIKSAQAVGGAVGKNPVSLLIPCHRILGVNGQLVGYAGGLDRKCWLLKHENIKFKEKKC